MYQDMSFNVLNAFEYGLAVKTLVVKHVFMNFFLVTLKRPFTLITFTAHVTNTWLATFITMASVPLRGICHQSLAKIAVTAKIWCMFNADMSLHGITQLYHCRTVRTFFLTYGGFQFGLLSKLAMWFVCVMRMNTAILAVFSKTTLYQEVIYVVPCIVKVSHASVTIGLFLMQIFNVLDHVCQKLSRFHVP